MLQFWSIWCGHPWRLLRMVPSMPRRRCSTKRLSAPWTTHSSLLPIIATMASLPPSSFLLGIAFRAPPFVEAFGASIGQIGSASALRGTILALRTPGAFGRGVAISISLPRPGRFLAMEPPSIFWRMPIGGSPLWTWQLWTTRSGALLSTARVSAGSASPALAKPSLPASTLRCHGCQEPPCHRHQCLRLSGRLRRTTRGILLFWARIRACPLTSLRP
mmetsp:Transcript_90098/g.254074  ORF Transcript_90098/g.254074 Transcript_90098/m.254074 type:complete len:218 (+) Transcript_90098:74-727(+)